MKKLLKNFCIGAAVYPVIELAWRGRTHIYMSFAGGVGFCALDGIHTKMKNRNKCVKALAGCAALTTLELALGCSCNKDHKIWDYSNLPLNYKGQICLPYSALWFALCFGSCLFKKS